MTSDEATCLAATIDKSHAPYSVKRVMVAHDTEAVVEVQDNETGYTTLIHNADHWRMFISQSGNAGAVDMFGEASTRLLAHLGDQIVKHKEERDRYMALAEQSDTHVQTLTAQRATIEKALEVVSVLDVELLPNAPLAPTKRKQGKPHKLPGNQTQFDWVRGKLADNPQVRCKDLGDELASILGTNPKRMLQNVSSILSNLVKIGEATRVSTGIYAKVYD